MEKVVYNFEAKQEPKRFQASITFDVLSASHEDAVETLQILMNGIKTFQDLEITGGSVETNKELPNG